MHQYDCRDADSVIAREGETKAPLRYEGKAKREQDVQQLQENESKTQLDKTRMQEACTERLHER